LTPTNDGHAHGFHNITHAQLVEGIRGQVGHYATLADTRYLTFLLDFLNTLDNLQVDTAMSEDFLHLVSQRKDDVDAFLDATKRLKDELRDKVNALAALIDVTPYTNVRQYPWRQVWSLADFLVHDVTHAPDLVIEIDTVVTPVDWQVEIFSRKGDRSQLRDLLQQLAIPVNNADRFVTVPAVSVCREPG
jgi:hypothetical protein